MRAEQCRRSLGYKTVVVLDFQTSSTTHAECLLKAAGSEACMYIEGGNTFALRHFARPFDDLCMHALKYQGVSCVAISAGMLLCGSSVQTALWKRMDDPHPPCMP